MSWITIKPQIEGNSTWFRTCYYSSLARHEDRALAISAGFEEYGCDDFLVGEVVDSARGVRLLRVSWMEEERDDQKELAEIARQLSIEPGDDEEDDPFYEEF